VANSNLLACIQHSRPATSKVRELDSQSRDMRFVFKQVPTLPTPSRCAGPNSPPRPMHHAASDDPRACTQGRFHLARQQATTQRVCPAQGSRCGRVQHQATDFVSADAAPRGATPEEKQEERRSLCQIG
jgi:hypothetical protein